MRVLISILSCALILAIAECLFAGSISTDLPVSALPVMSLRQDQLSRIPILIHNESSDLIVLAIDDSGLRNIEVMISRDGQVVLDIEAMRTDPRTSPRRQLLPGEQVMLTLNLGNHCDVASMQAGTYRVTGTIWDLQADGHVPLPTVGKVDFMIQLSRPATTQSVTTSPAASQPATTQSVQSMEPILRAIVIAYIRKTNPEQAERLDEVQGVFDDQGTQWRFYFDNSPKDFPMLVGPTGYYIDKATMEVVQVAGGQ